MSDIFGFKPSLCVYPKVIGESEERAEPDATRTGQRLSQISEGCDKVIILTLAMVGEVLSARIISEVDRGDKER